MHSIRKYNAQHKVKGVYNAKCTTSERCVQWKVCTMHSIRKYNAQHKVKGVYNAQHQKGVYNERCVQCTASESTMHNIKWKVCTMHNIRKRLPKSCNSKQEGVAIVYHHCKQETCKPRCATFLWHSFIIYHVWQNGSVEGVKTRCVQDEYHVNFCAVCNAWMTPCACRA